MKEGHRSFEEPSLLAPSMPSSMLLPDMKLRQGTDEHKESPACLGSAQYQLSSMFM